MSEIVPFDLLTSNIEDPARSTVEDEDEFDHVVQDLWVGIALALLVLSCVACLCAAFLFRAFKQWQRRVAEAQHVEGGYDTESLPSYTVVAGLPTYEEALEQLRKASASKGDTSPSNTGSAPNFSKLSVGDLLEIYKVNLEKKN